MIEIDYRLWSSFCQQFSRISSSSPVSTSSYDIDGIPHLVIHTFSGMECVKEGERYKEGNSHRRLDRASKEKKMVDGC